MKTFSQEQNFTERYFLFQNYSSSENFGPEFSFPLHKILSLQTFLLEIFSDFFQISIVSGFKILWKILLKVFLLKISP